ncbi:hypothetical protein GCM10022267_74530 [Lentzea roselyniae]|uniref:Uncharacterized protein n=1 Tax=Lentzea roselyniae TaxID=531940 RepID=A0ABP7C1K8_9PSEU
MLASLPSGSDSFGAERSEIPDGKEAPEQGCDLDGVIRAVAWIKDGVVLRRSD